MIDIQVKRLTDYAKLPTRAYEHDAGWDLYSAERAYFLPRSSLTISLGIAVAIPDDHCLLILDRSGLALAGITRRAGLIDAGYRGEISVVLVNESNYGTTIQVGDKIAQMILLPVPRSCVVEVASLSPAERGKRGFGSSGG